MHSDLALKGLNSIGEAFDACRRRIVLTREEGLTNTYNRFHNPGESAADIRNLRDLHLEIDKAAAYGWNDLHLGHGFHETKQGARFSLSESARREVLARLLKLNHERYAEEVVQGLQEKKSGGKKSGELGVGSGEKKTGTRGRKAKAPQEGPGLKFGDHDDEPDPDRAADSGPPSALVQPSPRPARADQRVQPVPAVEPLPRAIPIDQFDTDAIMAAFRQSARGRGWLDRDELLKHVSVVLGYQRLGPKIDESLRGHLRAAIRRRIIEADSPSLVHAGTGTMSDYGLDELRETFRSVMRKGTNYEREDVVHALASYLGFVRVTDSIRQPIKSAINSAIRRGLLGFEGSVIWSEE